jgi:hypothetical protein
LAQIEPWHDTEFRAAAIIAATVHNTFQMFVKNPKRKDVEDFMPKWEEAVAPEPEMLVEGEGTELATEIQGELDADALFAKSSWMFAQVAAANKGKPN